MGTNYFEQNFQTSIPHQILSSDDLFIRYEINHTEWIIFAYFFYYSLLFPVFIFCIRLVHLSQIVQFLWWFILNQALSSFFLDNLIRLSGSNEPCSGRVEIYYSGVWGTVCDDLWDLNDAAVACRQLGCGPALGAPYSAQFGQGTGPIWLDNLGCSGNETFLAVCGHNGFGIHNCVHGEDAGVICSSKIAYNTVKLIHQNHYSVSTDRIWA